MKKYLMTGMAALAFCAAFTSCSKGEDLYDENLIEKNGVEKIKADYEAAFIATFGQPAPNQDWGFNSTQASTREEKANANQWADTAYEGLKVPPKLTDEQIAVVKKYFQITQNIPYQDPQWSDYFVQQVYKGHSSPMTGTDPNTGKPYSPEAYMALNGTTELYASDYMDHLAAIDEEKNFFDHINNFNHGDCGENDHVLDNGGDTNNGPFHTDKIMLMQNSTTKSFGYFNSNGSLYHNEYTGLVSYKTIMDALGAEANCLDDGWDRSFMGFDFEQMIEGQCYANENEVWDYSTQPATFKSGTPKNLIIYGEYYINGVKQTNYVYQYNNEPVKMLSDQMNRYCGEKIDVTNEQLYTELRDADNNNAYIGTQLNTDFIDGLLAQGYLPVDNKSLRVWAKVGGCADGYYSDWIVTLTEAKTNKKANLIIIAEDLSVGDGSEDFDFNDVVFEVYFGDAGKAKAKILAAGGTLQLKVDGKEVHQEFSKANDNIDCAGKMINTNGTQSVDPNVRNKSLDNLKAPEIPLTKEVKSAIQARDNIAIEVLKEVNGKEEWITLEAVIGKVASKVRVDIDYQWKDEREYVGDGFKAFVNGTASWDEWYQQ